MCEDCGCGEIYENEHGHDHEHPHKHEHDGFSHTHDHAHPHEDGHAHSHDGEHKHNHDHQHDSPAPRIVQVAKKVLAHNDELAEQNRQWLKEKGVMAINLISSPGSGKTLLLEKTLEALGGKVKCAVIVGDQQTDNDAQRLVGKGAEICQIETENACHLNAEQVGEVLPEVVADETGLLFIENVGNLVCPAAFDLGESFKVALLSTPEGEDKAVKYPTLFADAKVVLLTKMDLVPHLDWDLKDCRQNIRRIQPGVFIFEVSAKTGIGMNAWLAYLQELVD